MPKLTSNLVFEALRSVSFCGQADAADEHLADVLVPAGTRAQIGAAAEAIAGYSQRGEYGQARKLAAYAAETIKVGEGKQRLSEADHQLADQVRSRASTGESYARSSYGGSATSKSFTPRGY